MTTPDLYGVGTVALLVLLFYGVRSIPAYVALSTVILGGFAAATSEYAAERRGPGWFVMLSGLLLCAVGLLIVRTMLVRSVSLHLLRCIESGRPDAFGEDIATRLVDMRAFSLIRSNEAGNTLTIFGRLVGWIATALYWLCRIRE